MANITLKNIPDELYETLKLMAKENRRSLNNEIIFHAEQAVKRKQKQAEVQTHAKRLREMTAHYYLTDEELNHWKNEGRP